jgi:hypothetical protein
VSASDRCDNIAGSTGYDPSMMMVRMCGPVLVAVVGGSMSTDVDELCVMMRCREAVPRAMVVMERKLMGLYPHARERVVSVLASGCSKCRVRLQLQIGLLVWRGFMLLTDYALT